ncbi:MAG: hypothetical protein ABJG94_17365 [Nitratireductor sp.]
MLLKRRMQHGGNPVPRRCFENSAMTKSNRNGNRLVSKAAIRGRIDGASGRAYGNPAGINGRSERDVLSPAYGR